MSRSCRFTVAVALALLAVLVPGPRASSQSAAVTYRPPVDAPVIDPFRAPTSPYGPGNRGIEYATVPGTPVRTIAPGTVTFAGTAAGTRYVTVAHTDGLRSSYGGLQSISVDEGTVLEARDEVGRAGASLHLGVRRGEEYLDPELLFAQAPPLVRLIPVEDFDGADPEVGPAPDALGTAIAARLAAA